METQTVKMILLTAVMIVAVSEAAALTGLLLRLSGAPPGRGRKTGRWNLQLVNMADRTTLYKTFQGAVILGRGQPAQETADRLFLGQDMTISRSQCCLIPWKGQVFVRNLAQVNLTYHNRNPLLADEVVQAGDVLQSGGQSYYVAALYQG